MNKLYFIIVLGIFNANAQIIDSKYFDSFIECKKDSFRIDSVTINSLKKNIDYNFIEQINNQKQFLKLDKVDEHTFYSLFKKKYNNKYDLYFLLHKIPVLNESIVYCLIFYNEKYSNHLVVFQKFEGEIPFHGLYNYWSEYSNDVFKIYKDDTFFEKKHLSNRLLHK